MTTTTVTLVDPVGREEIAERLGVTRNTVDSWRSRGRHYEDSTRGRPFPDPDCIRSSTPLWSWAHVEEWARETGRTE